MQERLSLVISWLLVLLLCTACSARPAPPDTAAVALQTVIDDSGYQLTVPIRPQRIVSLMYSVDEILVELVAIERIKAFSRWADDPEITFITAEQAARVTARAVPYAESLVALQPDLIIASPVTRPEVIKTLRELGIPVYISASPKNIVEVRRRIMNLARAVGAEVAGAQLVKTLDLRLQEVETKVAAITPKQQKCALAFDFVGIIGNRNNLLAEIFRRAQVRNGAQVGIVNVGENRLSSEQVVAVNPDFILLPTWNYDDHSDATQYRQQFIDDPALVNVTAIKQRQVVFVSDRYRYVGSQHVASSIEVLAQTVYPELFESLTVGAYVRQ